MDENNDKFIIGDNTDGYRRSQPDYDLDLFAERKKPAEEIKPEQPAGGAPGQRRPAQTQRRPAPANKKNGVKTPNFFTRKPSQPVPEKKGPTVKRHGKPPVLSDARRKDPRSRRPAPSPEEAALSENERRRLHAERRRAQRRRKTIIQYVAIGVAVIGVMVALSLTVFFKIDEIQIVGESPYTNEEIIASSGIDFDENIIMCDVNGVSDRLAKALPYIGSAQVKRSLNGKVTITVTMTHGCYSFINGENAVVINDAGKVLGQVTAEEAKSFTVVDGVSVVKSTPGESVELSDKGAFDLLKTLRNQLETAGIDKITSIDITDVYNISCVYDGRLTLAIGGMGSIENKLALAAKVIERENELDPAQYGRIDLDSVEGKAFFKPLENPESETQTDEDADTQEDSSQTEEESTESQTEAEE